MTAITKNDLIISFNEVKKNLFNFVLERRTNPNKSLKKNDLNRLFKNSILWQTVSNGTGHNVFRHKVTHVLVSYQAHNTRSKDTTVESHIAQHVLESVQEHMNILANDIFKLRNWQKEAPNFQQALLRLKQN